MIQPWLLAEENIYNAAYSSCVEIYSVESRDGRVTVLRSPVQVWKLSVLQCLNISAVFYVITFL